MKDSATPGAAADFYRSIYGSECEALARAPGRIEFIGNHTDYNGGRVAGAAVDRFVVAAAGRRSDRAVCFASALSPETAFRELGDFRKFSGALAWANYPLGIFSVMTARGLHASYGLNLAIVSDLPAGAGLSSSAALEVAAALAIGRVYGENPSATDLVAIGRTAENRFLGLPSGPLDQSVCVHGRENHLVFIDCKHLSMELVPLPGPYRIAIFNSGISHSLVDSLYAQRHNECAEALRLLRVIHPDLENLVDAPEPALDHLPADTPPAVAMRARHVIREHGRVAETREALRSGDMPLIGRLLRESHASSRTLFENSCPELDTLAGLLNEHPKVLGARLSGGGFGGSVMALVSREFGETDARAIADCYESVHGGRPEFLHCAVTGGAGPVSTR